MRRLGAIVLAAAVTMIAPALAAGRSLPGTPVPHGFVGMNIDGPMLTPQDGVAMPNQFGVMRSNGVQSIRAVFSWSVAQPYASWAQVPASQHGAFVSGAAGVPTNFAGTDQIVQLAAARGMTVLPTVIDAPAWDAGPRSGVGLAQPRDDAPYGRYLTTLIQRYGPRGSFWRAHPGLRRRPIRMWEVWNEPDIVGYWPTQPFAPSYVALLRAAHSAAKRADRGAQVVLAGVPNFSWQILKEIYHVRGARGAFDVVDVHPYTKQPAGVIKIMQLVRASMKRGGDARKPIIAGETGWPSSLNQTPHHFDFETTVSRQAQNARALLPLLAANRQSLQLLGFYWYTWMGDEFPGAFAFNFSGLMSFRNGQVQAKPALKAFGKAARAIER
jgi:hypothetical protein